MPWRDGSHWSGPNLGSANAAGGLFEDAPVAALSARACAVFVDDFFECGAARMGAAGAGTHYTNTNIVGGTVAAAAGAVHYLRLSHGTAAQGPSVMFGGTVATAPDIYLGSNPLQNQGSTAGLTGFAALEFRVRPTDNTPNSAYFFGFSNVAAAHPLDATGAINVAGLSDGAGFHWTNAGGNVPVMRIWTGGALVTLSSPPTLSAWVPGAAGTGQFRRYGVRIDTSPRATTPIDQVSFYVEGQRVFRHQMAAQFGAAMTAVMGATQIGAGAISVDIDYLVMANSERA